MGATYERPMKIIEKLDPVGLTERYEVMKPCTGLVKDSNGWDLVVLSQYETYLER